MGLNLTWMGNERIEIAMTQQRGDWSLATGQGGARWPSHQRAECPPLLPLRPPPGRGAVPRSCPSGPQAECTWPSPLPSEALTLGLWHLQSGWGGTAHARLGRGNGLARLLVPVGAVCHQPASRREVSWAQTHCPCGRGSAPLPHLQPPHVQSQAREFFCMNDGQLVECASLHCPFVLTLLLSPLPQPCGLRRSHPVGDSSCGH